MAKHTIEIHVDNRGNFTYFPALLHATPKDRISWLSNDGDFTVSFPEKTPFKKVDFQGIRGQTTPSEHFRPRVDPGVYHYRVAVARQVQIRGSRRGVTVFLDSGCPGIHI